MPTETYRLPNFLALLPKKPGDEINPHFKEVETEFNAWVENLNLSECLTEPVFQGEIPLFVSMTYPSISHEQSMGIINFLTLWFMLDDLTERMPSNHLSSLLQLGLNFLSDGENVQNPLAKMMGSGFMSSIKAAVGSFHWPQFIDQHEKMAMHLVQEAHDREVSIKANVALDVQSYIVKRRWTIGAGPCFLFCRSTHCLYIPNGVLANPIIQETEDAAAEMMLIANDILSFKKEVASGSAFLNILTVMQKDPETAHLDFQKTLDCAGELFKAALKRFEVCRRNLPSFSPDMDQYLALYADGLLDFVIGNVRWSLVCRRYSTFVNEEDRRNNALRLPSQWLPRQWNAFLTIFCFSFLLLYTFLYYTK